MLNTSIHRMEDALIDAFSHIQLTYEQCKEDMEKSIDHVKEHLDNNEEIFTLGGIDTSYTTIEQKLAIRKQKLSQIRAAFTDSFVGFRDLFIDKPDLSSNTKTSKDNIPGGRTPLQERHSNIVHVSKTPHDANSKEAVISNSSMKQSNNDDQMKDVTPLTSIRSNTSASKSKVSYKIDRDLSSEFQQITIESSKGQDNFVSHSTVNKSKTEVVFNEPVSANATSASLDQGSKQERVEFQKNEETDFIESPLRSREKAKKIYPDNISNHNLLPARDLFTEKSHSLSNSKQKTLTPTDIKSMMEPEGVAIGAQAQQLVVQDQLCDTATQNSNEDLMTDIEESVEDNAMHDIDLVTNNDVRLSKDSKSEERTSMFMQKQVDSKSTEIKSDSAKTVDIKGEQKSAISTNLEDVHTVQKQTEVFENNPKEESHILSEISTHSISPSSRESSIVSQQDVKNVSSVSDDAPSNQISSFKARLHRLKSSSKRLVSGTEFLKDVVKDEPEKESSKMVRHIALRDLPPSPAHKYRDSLHYNFQRSSQQSDINTSSHSSESHASEKSSVLDNTRVKEESKRKENPLSKYRIDKEIPPFDSLKRQKIGKVQRISNKSKSSSSSPSKSEKASRDEPAKSVYAPNLVSNFKVVANRSHAQSTIPEGRKLGDTHQSAIPIYSTASAFSNLATGILTFFKGEEPKKPEKQKKIVIPSLLQAEAAKQKQIEDERKKAQRKELMKKRREKKVLGVSNNSTAVSNSSNLANQQTFGSTANNHLTKKRKLEKKTEGTRKRSRVESDEHKVLTSKGAHVDPAEHLNVSTDTSIVSAKSNTSTVSNYQISEGWKSESDTEDEIERSKKRIPQWAQGKEFKDQLAYQHANKDKFNGDKIFGPCAKYCSLREIFPDSKNFRSRSSGIWGDF